MIMQIGSFIMNLWHKAQLSLYVAVFTPERCSGVSSLSAVIAIRVMSTAPLI